MPSVREIAQYAGVSKSTVSLVLNNKPGVSPGKREQILHALKQLKAQEEADFDSLPASDYVVKKPSTFSIVVLHPAILHSNQVHAEFLRGIQDGADRYQAQLRLATKPPVESDSHISRLYITDPDLRPDGLLIMGARVNEPLAEEAREHNIPFVLVSRHAPKSEDSAVGWDDSEAAYLATKHLIDLGHQSIAFIGGDEMFSYTNDRIAGFQEAMLEAGLASTSDQIYLGDGEQATRRFAEVGRHYSAALFINDTHAVAGIPILKGQGFTIPEDLSIISFDDTRKAESASPPLSSVFFPRYQTGLWAVKTLIDQIRNPLLKSSQIIFNCSLTLRASCVETKP